MSRYECQMELCTGGEKYGDHRTRRSRKRDVVTKEKTGRKGREEEIEGWR